MNLIKSILIGTLLLSSLLFASIGKITVATGDVSIVRASKTIKALSNTPLEEKDQVLTKSGSAQLIFSDGTSISIGANTNFKVQEFLYEDGNAQKSNAKFGVSEGAFKAITGKIGKLNPEKFKLETKTATIGIRGTRFLGIVPAKGPETVACTFGRISVTIRPIVVIAPTGPIGGVGAPAPTPGAQPTPGAPTPGAQPSGPSPLTPTPPAPQTVEVNAGQMTTVSATTVSVPKAYTPAEINKLEKAAESSSAPSSKSDQGTTQGGTATKSGDSGGGGNTQSSSTSTSSTTNTQTSNTPTPTAPIAPPKIDTSSIANTINNVQNTVTNVQNTIIGDQNNQLLEPIVPVVAPPTTEACPYGGTFPNCNPPTNSGTGGGGEVYSPYVNASLFNLYPVNIITNYSPNFNVDFTTTYSNSPTAVTSSPQTNVVRFFVMSNTDNAYSYNPFNQDSQVYVNAANGNILHMNLQQSFWNSYPNIDSSIAIGKFTSGTFNLNDKSSWCSNGGIASELATGTGQMYSNGNTFGLVMTAYVGYSNVASSVGDYSFTLNDANSHFSTGDQLKIVNDIYTVASVNGNVITITSPLVSSAYGQAVYTYNKVGGIKDSGYTIPNEGTSTVGTDYTSTAYNAKGTWTAITMDSSGIGNTASAPPPTWINGPDVTNYNGTTNFQATINKSTGDITLAMTDQAAHLSILSTNNALTNGSNQSAYISEDVWGGMPTTGTFDANGLNNTRFMALPDKIDANGFLSYSDDYSSWGYWQADHNTSASTSKSEIGWWVAGAVTPTGVIDALISAHTTYTYNGHVMGAAIYNGTNIELIKMNAANKAQISINFGSANPVSGSFQFQTGASDATLKNWSSTFSGAGTGSITNTNYSGNGNFATNSSFGYNGAATGTGNGSAVTATSLNGQYYGPAANSVGGSFAITAGSHSAQGVFKGDR